MKFHRHARVIIAACALGLAGCNATPSSRSPASTPPPAASAGWGPDTTVGRIVADEPDAARIFELVGIDYCCGGKATLGAAAQTHGLDTGRLLAALEVLGRKQPGDAATNWQDAPAGALIDHIERTYHAELRRDLPRIDDLTATVLRVHGSSHPELAELRETFRGLRAGMEKHILEEEQVVFPAILRAADGGRSDGVEDLLRGLENDHEEVGLELAKLRSLTRGYTPPADACTLYREMLRSLERLERRTLTHVHLENNVLFMHAR